MTYNSEAILTLARVPKETVTYTFDTTVVEARVDVERRIPQRAEYLAEFELNDLVLKRDELFTLQTFYKDVQGNVQSFKYKSYVDYSITSGSRFYSQDGINAQPIVIDFGQAIFIPGTVADYQIFQVFRVGTVSPSDSVQSYKTIKKIDASTLRVEVAGVETTAFTVDTETGVITFNTKPPDADFVGVDCEFYHEVRFSMESLAAQRISPTEYQISSITLQEEVTTARCPLESKDWQSITYGLQPAYDALIQEDILLEIKATELDNGRNQRSPRELAPDFNLDIGDNTVTNSEAFFLRTWFLVAKGRLLDFQFDRFFTRFNTDSFTLTTEVLDSTNSGCLWYTTGNLALRGKEKPTQLYETPPLSFDFEPVFLSPTEDDANVITSTSTSGSFQGTLSNESPSASSFSTTTASFSASASFDVPSANDPNPTSYRAVTCFYAGGTFHLFLTSTSGSSVMRGRFIYYRMPSPWTFEYADVGIEQYKASGSLASQNSHKVYETPTGVSIFFDAIVDPSFTQSGGNSNFVRIEIGNDGSISHWSVPKTNLTNQTVSNRPFFYSKKDNAAFVFRNTSNIEDYGVHLGGIHYYGAKSGSSGTPFSANVNANGTPYNGNTNNPPTSEFQFNADGTPQAGLAPIDLQLASNTFATLFVNNSSVSTSIEATSTQVDGSVFYRLSINNQAWQDTPDRALGKTLLHTRFNPVTNAYTPVVLSSRRSVTLNTDIMYYFHNFSWQSQQMACDSANNQVVSIANRLVYIPGNSGKVFDLASQGLTTRVASSSCIQITPFGFLILGSSSSNLLTNSDLQLYFVQTSKTSV